MVPQVRAADGRHPAPAPIRRRGRTQAGRRALPESRAGRAGHPGCPESGFLGVADPPTVASFRPRVSASTGLCVPGARPADGGLTPPQRESPACHLKEGNIHMNSDYTHIAIILDRTGSMESIRDDTIGGFNAFLDQQKAEPGSATLTLVQFDSQDPYEVIHRFRPLSDVPHLTRGPFVPRASSPSCPPSRPSPARLVLSLDERRPSCVLSARFRPSQCSARWPC